MSENIKVATWNLCLGLPNKKDYIDHKLNHENIDICALQECEVSPLLDEKHLSLRDYKIELETNNNKKRTGIYIHNRLSYLRRKDLEDENLHLVIIDVDGINNLRIISIYRSFTAPSNLTPTDQFKLQIETIKRSIDTCINRTAIVLGDFNLDYRKIYNPNYPFKKLFEFQNEIFDPLGLIQLINFDTWTRTINGIKRSSILDHIYTTNPLLINNIMPIITEIGDHVLVTFKINFKRALENIIWKRDWRNYNKNLLMEKLNNCDFNTNLNCVQETWNRFENVMINIVDELTPLVPYSNGNFFSNKTPPKIKNLLNIKKRLLKLKKKNCSEALCQKLKSLDKEIKHSLSFEKTKHVRQGILPGNSKTLWNSVKKAKNMNINSLPEDLTINQIPINLNELPDAFADFFSNKVKKIVTECKVDNNVYNGKRKLYCQNKNFMTPDNIIKAIRSLKLKNCEGFDRIPVRYLIDGIIQITPVLSHLFNLIYLTKQIPDQWRISKVIPILKKGNPHQIENYRPISNLCSTSKIFEKLILIRLLQIEEISKISLTGTPQHGFKKNHGTSTLGLTVQSLISHALDENNYAIMASLDLSAAFDVVNVELLLKRLNIIGIPSDVVSLIETWLSQRLFYVSINGEDSCLTASETGTIQGSILGPILYAIFVSPLFDLHKISNYADDNFIIRWSRSINDLIIDMQTSLEAIIKWLRQSGLKVNEAKTEMCLFHRNDTRTITLQINNSRVTSTPQINVLGVIFDSKMQWNEQVSKTIKKANKALLAIKLIKKHFTYPEIKTLLTTNFYSILYYNSEIWHTPTLKPYLKNLLLSTSARALQICTPNYTPMMSFKDLHSINLRATPVQFMFYKHSILLHSIYNDKMPMNDWLDLNFNQNFNQRETNFRAFNKSKYKVGKNKISERLTILNGKIPLEWLNLNKITFKLQCKQKFLPH